MKRLISIFTVLLVFLGLNLMASEPVGILVNNSTNCIQLINPLTQELSPEYFKGQLGGYNSWLLEALITKDGTRALVYNVRAQTLYIFNISGGFTTPPTIDTALFLGVSSFDMVLTPDSQFLVMAGDFGGGPQISRAHARSLSGIITVNLSTLAVKKIKIGHDIATWNIDITPDGNTLVFTDIMDNMIHSFSFNANAGTATWQDTCTLPVTFPSNISIAPDGKTIIVPLLASYKLAILQLYGNSKLHFKELVQLPVKGSLDVIFSKDGTTAYCLAGGLVLLGREPSSFKEKSRKSDGGGASIIVLDITGGNVTVKDSIQLTLPRYPDEVSIDAMAIDPSGNYLYVSNTGITVGIKEVTVVDLITNTEINQLTAHGLPCGIAFGVIE